MVFFQIRYELNTWLVLTAGVAGSAVGRYLLSAYIPVFFGGFINNRKKEDILFIGSKLSNNSWQVQVFVLLYTLVPLPSAPLFIAAGMAKIRAVHFIPSFILGKFSSDMVMMISGGYAAKNAINLAAGIMSWESIAGCSTGIFLVVLFFCIDWRILLQKKRLRFSFNIWK